MGAIPVIPLVEGFPEGAAVVAFTDISGSRGRVPWRDTTVSRSVAMVLIDGVGSGMMLCKKESQLQSKKMDFSQEKSRKSQIF